MSDETRRRLPGVDSVLSDSRVAALIACCGESVKTNRRLARIEVRDYLEELRAALGQGQIVKFDWTVMLERLKHRLGPSLRRSINATGVVLHTGMGRAALSRAAQLALVSVSENFCNLAIDTETGRRRERYWHVDSLLCELTGAEAAMVVNNNAAATYLILNTLAEGKEVIVSRGQLVEIGGAFRMPDIMARSGVRMVEVGTTNRTHLRDYRAAIRSDTALLMHVHMSNYRILGFTASVGIAELVQLGREFGIPVVDDLGSGALIDLTRFGLPAEPLVQDSIGAGASIVCFSGDKLLGGPQCGVIIGKRELVERLKRNPLTRALRCGKLTYAALEATLRLFLDEERLVREHAVLGQLLKPIGEMEEQIRRVIDQLQDVRERAEFALTEGRSEVGGGSLATIQLPTRILVIKPALTSAQELAVRLRHAEPPVFVRIEQDRVVLDFRTIRPDEERPIIDAMKRALCLEDVRQEMQAAEG